MPPLNVGIIIISNPITILFECKILISQGHGESWLYVPMKVERPIGGDA